MEILILILTISSSACFIAEFSGIAQHIEWKWNIGRPLNCPMCLSFWLGMPIFIWNGYGLMSFLYSLTCSVLSIYIVKYAK